MSASRTLPSLLSIVARWMVPALLAAPLVPSGCDMSAAGGESGTAYSDDDTGADPGAYGDRGATDGRDNGRQDRGMTPGKGTVKPESDTGEPSQTGWEYVLQYRHIVISPDGSNILVNVPKPGPAQGFEKPGVVLALQPLPSGDARVMPQYQDVERINFLPDGSQAFLLHKGGRTVSRLSLETYEEVAAYSLPGPYSVLDVTPDGSFLLLTNLPTTAVEEQSFGKADGVCSVPPGWDLPEGADLCEAAIVDLDAGTVLTVALPHRIRDVDYDLLTGDVIFSYSVTPSNGQTPTSTMLFVSPYTGDYSAKLVFPNCSDEVVVSHAADVALQAPTHCSYPATFNPKKPMEWERKPEAISTQFSPDPISVIDLVARKFVTNLPGYGPVALSPDGKTAVGFTLREVMKSQWDYYDQQELVGLIFVDTLTLDWSIVEYGSEIPAYTYSPDGMYLYVYSDLATTSGQVERFDLKTLARHKLGGPAIDLDAFAWLPSGSQMYAVYDKGLYFIDAASPDIKQVGVSVEPDLIAVRPQGDLIVLAPADKPLYYTLPAVSSATSLEPSDEFDLSLGLPR